MPCFGTAWPWMSSSWKSESLGLRVWGLRFRGLPFRPFCRSTTWRFIRWSRALHSPGVQGMEGLPIHLIPAAELIRKQIEKWSLRLTLNPKPWPCFLETFRTKSEALLASVLMKEIRNPISGGDLAAILQHYVNATKSLVIP